jgi:hypothetical protein
MSELSFALNGITVGYGRAFWVMRRYKRPNAAASGARKPGKNRRGWFISDARGSRGDKGRQTVLGSGM